MKTSITLATFLVAGAGVAGVSGLVNGTSWFGSDTLFTITQAVITAANPPGLSSSAYVGGGSGGGASAMAAGTTVAGAAQVTAPMSRMIKSEGHVCGTGAGGFQGQSTPGGADLNATGIVIGLDGVDIYASPATGTAVGGTTCNGPSDAQSNDNQGYGLAYSGTQNVFGTTALGQTAAANSKQTWKWVLALVYGGNDLSVHGGSPSGVPDCNQAARKNLVANWSSMFQNCTNTDSVCTAQLSCSDGSGACGSTATKTTACGSTTGATCSVQGSILWHAFRRDDTSGTSDVFATILGLSPGTSSSSNNGFGASPYCNAINIDTSATVTAQCTAAVKGSSAGLPHDQWTGPGGIIDPASTLVIGATTVGAAGSGNHHRPPPGTWGDAPDLTATGVINSADVLPTQQQDNDPIRRPCWGNGTTGNVTKAGEEVCNIDGALGLVLPMVDTDFMVTQSLQQYPTNPTTNLLVLASRSVAVLTCPVTSASKHNGQCPNGDANAFSSCYVPIDGTNNTSQTLTQKSTQVGSLLNVRPSCASNYGANPAWSLANNALTTAASGCLANKGASDGRAYNLQMWNGNATSPVWVGELIPALLPNGATAPLTCAHYPNACVDMAAGYNRIHAVETLLGAATTSPPVGAAAGCQYEDMTDQIACLAQADPCSIGYAGDAGKAIQTAGIPNAGTNTLGSNGTSVSNAWFGTTGALGGLDSARVAQVYPSATTVQLLGQAGEYQIARKLYFNSLVGFQSLQPAATGNSTWSDSPANELEIAKFEANPAQMNSIVVAQKEFTLGQQFAGDTSGNPDPQFCEDFNEHNVCGTGAPTNQNGCSSLVCSTLVAADSATCVTAGATCGTGGTCLGMPTGIPGGAAGAAGSNTGAVGANQAAGTSTVCGDGIRQAYEECDNGTANSNSDTSAGGCSLTCRCNNDFVVTGGVGACN
jgi:hypothetical protein